MKKIIRKLSICLALVLVLSTFSSCAFLKNKLKNIKEPALIINGTNDLCTPLVAKTMYDSIPNSRWELFADCRHACFVEDTDRYCRLLSEWMDQND